MRRGRDPNRQEISETVVETTEGQLIRFEFQMDMGAKPMRETGEVRGDHLDIRVAGSLPAAPSDVTLAWKPGDGGPTAAEESLSRRPMQPGEHRKLQVLEPAVNLVTNVEMTARDFEPTATPSGVRRLLRVERVTRLPGRAKTGRRHDLVRPHGRSHEDAGVGRGAGIVPRVEGRGAWKTPTRPSSICWLPPRYASIGRRADPQEMRQVRYRIRLKRSDPAGLLITGPTQAVRPIDPHTADITVYAIRPGQPDGNRNAPPIRPAAGDRRPNRFIQSDDPLVVSLAEKAAGKEAIPGPRRLPWSISSMNM